MLSAAFDDSSVIDHFPGWATAGILIRQPAPTLLAHSFQPQKQRDSVGVTFRVIFAACTIGSYINTYVVKRLEGKWTLKAIERGSKS
jgi:hypothetical protein